MADTTVYYKVSEQRLKKMLEAELYYIALVDNADVETWDKEKYDAAIKDYQRILAARFLPTGAKPVSFKEIAAIKAKEYRKVL